MSRRLSRERALRTLGTQDMAEDIPRTYHAPNKGGNKSEAGVRVLSQPLI